MPGGGLISSLVTVSRDFTFLMLHPFSATCPPRCCGDWMRDCILAWTVCLALHEWSSVCISYNSAGIIRVAMIFATTTILG